MLKTRVAPLWEWSRMVLLRRQCALARFSLIVPAVLLAACGSRASTVKQQPTPVARIAGVAITQNQIQRYTRYANRFFSAAYPGSSRASTTVCTGKDRSPTCVTVRRQVLARLLQQQVVLEYARKHHITLTAADKRHISAAMQTLLDPASDTADLYDHNAATSRFLRHVLQVQALVLKVEEHVAGPRASRGFAFHIEKYSIPPGTQAHQEALILATDGKPVPPDASVREEWEAPFRLKASVAQSISLAKAGDYVGPFPHHGGLLVIHVLGTGQHKYGRPARALLLTQLFQKWLQEHVRQAHPRCYAKQDRDACTLASMNTA